MEVSISLPRTVEGLTPMWLTAAIGKRCPGITVTAASTEKIIWGTSTKVFMDVEYRDGQEACGLPNKLCIKGEFDERVRQALAGVKITATQIEAEFYNDLGAQLGIPLPRHWFGGSEPGMGILILDNMDASNVTFGKPTQPWSPDLAAKALDILAILHSSTWGRAFPDISWLQGPSPVVRQYTEFLMSEAHWREHFAKPEVFKLPSALSERERVLKALRAMWHSDDQKPICLVHGDTHLGNTCIDASGQPFFIDWAGPCMSHWALDVSYFITGALSVADRRASERDLFRHYLDRLATHGGLSQNTIEAWDDYRRHQMHGIAWTTLPPTMQSLENVHAMGERYASAMIDHDTLRLLGA